MNKQKNDRLAEAIREIKKRKEECCWVGQMRVSPIKKKEEGTDDHAVVAIAILRASGRFLYQDEKLNALIGKHEKKGVCQLLEEHGFQDDIFKVFPLIFPQDVIIYTTSRVKKGGLYGGQTFLAIDAKSLDYRAVDQQLAGTTTQYYMGDILMRPWTDKNQFIVSQYSSLNIEKVSDFPSNKEVASKFSIEKHLTVMKENAWMKLREYVDVMLGKKNNSSHSYRFLSKNKSSDDQVALDENICYVVKRVWSSPSYVIMNKIDDLLDIIDYKKVRLDCVGKKTILVIGENVAKKLDAFRHKNLDSFYRELKDNEDITVITHKALNDRAIAIAPVAGLYGILVGDLARDHGVFKNKQGELVNSSSAYSDPFFLNPGITAVMDVKV